LPEVEVSYPFETLPPHITRAPEPDPCVCVVCGAPAYDPCDVDDAPYSEARHGGVVCSGACSIRDGFAHDADDLDALLAAVRTACREDLTADLPPLFVEFTDTDADGIDWPVRSHAVFVLAGDERSFEVEDPDDGHTRRIVWTAVTGLTPAD
jgi:hypothetical protein